MCQASASRKRWHTDPHRPSSRLYFDEAARRGDISLAGAGGCEAIPRQRHTLFTKLLMSMLPSIHAASI